MRHFVSLVFVFVLELAAAFIIPSNRWSVSRADVRAFLAKAELKYDSQGYLIKERDWFNGLSADPGNSLDDPRSVPPVAVAFADKIKGGKDKVTLKETLAFIDEHYLYFEVPFKNGPLYSKPNENVGSAKIFSFALMTRMSEAQALSMFGEVYDAVKATPAGTDHPNIRQFMKTGLKEVLFESGLAISSKLQAGDTTEQVEATQAPVIEKGSEWSFDSESFIP